MKKLKIVLIVLVVFILTGCMKYDTKMKINDDNTVELTIKYSIQNQSEDETINKNEDEDILDENFNTDSNNEETKITSDVEVNLEDYNFLKKYGYSIEEFTETLENGEEATGVIIFKKFNSLDEITSDKKLVLNFFEIFEEEDKNFSYDKFFYKEDNKYTADYIFDLTPSVNGQSGDFGIDYNQYSSLFNFRYSITLPDSVKYVESNATSISDDGKTLTWDMEIGKTHEITFGFAYDTYIKKLDKIFIYISLGAIGVSILAIIIISLTKLNDKKKIQIDTNEDGTQNENNVSDEKQ